MQAFSALNCPKPRKDGADRRPRFALGYLLPSRRRESDPSRSINVTRFPSIRVTNMRLHIGSLNWSSSRPRRSSHQFDPARSWCTGEDSNLRSSQGAADLQSAAINHSATCAHFDRALPRNSLESPIAEAWNRQFVLSKNSPRQTRNSGKTRQQPRARTSARLTNGKLLLDSVLRESCASRLACSCYASRRAQGFRFWSWRRDLNPRPSDYKSDALPAELRQPA